MCINSKSFRGLVSKVAMLHEKTSKFVMQTLFCHGEESLMLPYFELPVGNHTHHDITLTNGIQAIDKIVKTGSIQIEKCRSTGPYQADQQRPRRAVFSAVASSC